MYEPFLHMVSTYRKQSVLPDVFHLWGWKKSRTPSDCVFCLEEYLEPYVLLDQPEYIGIYR